jgi:hypothetical protein
MSDLKHAQSTAETAARTLDPELSQKLIALGFDPKAPVYKGSDWFKQSAIKRELFESAYPGPVILKFGGTDWDRPTHEEREASTWLAHVLVELATFRFETDTRGGDIGPGHRRRQPQLYIRGFLTDTATDAEPDAPRVHVLIDLNEYDESRPNPTAYFQVVDEPSPPDSDTVLVLGEGAPRGCQSSI